MKLDEAPVTPLVPVEAAVLALIFPLYILVGEPSGAVLINLVEAEV